MFFTFPEAVRWAAEQQALEFGSEIAGAGAWSGRAGQPAPAPGAPHPRTCAGCGGS